VVLPGVDRLDVEIGRVNAVSHQMMDTYVDWSPIIQVGDTQQYMYNELIDFVNFRMETAQTCCPHAGASGWATSVTSILTCLWNASVPASTMASQQRNNAHCLFAGTAFLVLMMAEASISHTSGSLSGTRLARPEHSVGDVLEIAEVDIEVVRRCLR
jgi:hypothetical protein